MQLSEEDFTQSESAAALDVHISKSRNIFIANPVRFRVSPLTIDEALARGIMTDNRLPPDESFSPNRASMN